MQIYISNIIYSSHLYTRVFLSPKLRRNNFFPFRYMRMGLKTPLVNFFENLFMLTKFTILPIFSNIFLNTYFRANSTKIKCVLKCIFYKYPREFLWSDTYFGNLFFFTVSKMLNLSMWFKAWTDFQKNSQAESLDPYANIWKWRSCSNDFFLLFLFFKLGYFLIKPCLVLWLAWTDFQKKSQAGFLDPYANICMWVSCFNEVWVKETP